MAVIDSGSSATGKANVDAAFNLNVTLPQVTTPAGASGVQYVGAARFFSENDPGTDTGTAYLKSPETSPDYRLRTGIDTVLLNDTFNATTQNTTNWSYTFNTLTAAQPGAGTVNFSTVQGTTSAHGAFMRTFQYFPLFGTAPLSHETQFGLFTAAFVANEVWLSGLGLPTAATTIPTDGVWWLYTSAGLIGVSVFNGVTTQTGTLLTPADYTTGKMYRHVIVCGERKIEFWRDDVLLAELPSPDANGQPFIQASLPAFMMKYNTGAVSNTNTVRVSDVTVTLMDIASNKMWGHQASTQGMSSYVGQNGHTQGKTSLWTNSTAPTAVALTNTTAAFTGLGGIVAVLPTLTANNDGILLNYTNPAPTINISGRNLIITGAKVQGVVTVAFVGGPVLYAYAIAFGQTAVSLATAETASFATATTHAPRIVPIGIESYAATAAVATIGQGATIDLSHAPITVRPGENVSIIARNMGTVTSSGAITLTCTLMGYWE